MIISAPSTHQNAPYTSPAGTATNGRAARRPSATAKIAPNSAELMRCTSQPTEVSQQDRIVMIFT